MDIDSAPLCMFSAIFCRNELLTMPFITVLIRPTSKKFRPMQFE